MSAPEPALRNVSDTARWVAIYRAMESERRDAHFRDPFARQLGGERGEAIVRSMPSGTSMSWPMVVRTCLLDEQITMLVRDRGVDAVLNLAAGLDARPWRMALPANLDWYDVDLPEILEHKRGVIGDAPASCRVHTRVVDLTQADARLAVIREVASSHANVVVMTEGLLVYLEPTQVEALGRDLHSAATLRWWLTDLASPRLLEFMAKRWSPKMREGNAPFRFAPPEGSRFFEPLGWREAEYRSLFDESLRLKRSMPMAWLWNLLGRLSPPARREEFRRFSGVVRFERA